MNFKHLYIVTIRRVDYSDCYVVGADTISEAVKKAEKKSGLDMEIGDETMSVQCLEDAELIF